MKTVPFARRYARALLDIAGAEAESFASQLQTLVEFFEGHAPLFAMLSLPTVTASQRLALLETVIAGCDGLSPLVANFLRVLCERNRLSALSMITRQYQVMVDEHAGRVRGTLTSAVQLDAAQVLAITQQLEVLTQRSVVLEKRIDPSVLGGVVATVGNQRFDGTLRAQLEALSAQLRAP